MCIRDRSCSGSASLATVAPSPRGDGAEERVAVLAGAEHDDLDVVAALGQTVDDLEPVHARHGDVEEQHAAGVLGDALQSLVAENPGCVLLLDITMPGMNGLEVVHRLAERSDDVKVVMLSAREDRDALF